MSDNGDEDHPYCDEPYDLRRFAWFAVLLWLLAITAFLAGCADGETFAFRGGQLLQLLKGVP